MITAYYNEFDPKAAAWLRQLIKNGDITPGEVDERSITEVTANDIKGYNRVHFFAGIGTWDYALNQAGWADRRVCTASLPCQPFSIAGKELGKQDERHLLPRFIELVKQCRFATILGEQVPGAIKHGWLDDLYTEMEACDYAIGAIIIGAHSVGAAHIRQRLYWMAHAKTAAWHGGVLRSDQGAYCGEFNGMGNAEHNGRNADAKPGSALQTSEKWREEGENVSGEFEGAGRPESATDIPGCEERQGVDWIYCRDGKYRPIKPGIQPLVDGSAEKLVRGGDTSTQINADATQEARAMRLKGYGNAIQAQTAELFIRVCKDILI